MGKANKCKRNKDDSPKKEKVTIFFSLILSFAGSCCFYMSASVISKIFTMSEPIVFLILAPLLFGAVIFGLIFVTLLAVLIII